MVTVQTIINPQNIIFEEECEQNFGWNLYQDNIISIKLYKDVNQKFIIIINEKKQPYELEKENIDQRSRLHFERVMALLRIYKRGNVQANSFQINIDGVPHKRRSFPYMNSWGPTLCSFYILNSSDKENMRDIFSYFEKLEIENTSLHWFTYAPFRPIIRDRLVDYVIALESMFIEYSLMRGKGPGKERTLKDRGRGIFNSLDYGSDRQCN